MTSQSKPLEKGSWYHDEDDGYAVSLKVEEILHCEKSEFQDITVFKSTSFGNVLILDGAIQCTERDEFTYQEMIAHLALNSHADPKQVLVIGGGDGGVVREVLKYPSVEKVVLCEIDQTVIDLCKKYLPDMTSHLADPRVKVHIQDGAEYIKDHTAEYDVIVVDSPSPLGAAAVLFEQMFYEHLKSALKPNGILACQGETLWFELPLIKSILGYCKKLFSSVAYASGMTPTFAGGQSGIVLCSTLPDHDFKKPVRDFTPAQLDAMKLRYYSPEVHRGAFTLPWHARKYLQDVLDN